MKLQKGRRGRREGRGRGGRRGAAAVEAALVLGVFFVLLMGVYEYCRYLMVLHVANNAARDGARYAAVNVGCDPSDAAAMQNQILSYTTARMGGVERNISGYQAAVYPCTSAGVAKPGNPAWNQASFTERIAVTIQGSYQPITPLLLLLPASFPIQATAVVASEG